MIYFSPGWLLLHPGVPQTTQPEDTGPAPISPVFRTGSEPLLSPRPRHTRPSHPGDMNTQAHTHLLYTRDTELTLVTPLSVPAGGGVTLRGSDGQLHPRAPPKPLRVSAVFPNMMPPPPTDSDEDPSSLYTELVIQVIISYSVPGLIGYL